MADHVVCVPGGSIEQIEDAHLIVAHSVAVALRAELRRSAPADVVLSNGRDGRADHMSLAADLS
jgi:hypothetical protein